MNLLDFSMRQLIIESGLAAVNNGLYIQAEAIRHVLPYLTENESACNIIDATILIGMNNLYLAEEKLQSDKSPEAELLKQFIEYITISNN
ncbi:MULTISPECIES: EscG/YscG/SsaH family type III secretion system needle protein co-chaperone [Providencia]|nr:MULTISPECIES: EscG/YscG/SsaH family type III secretion system needle protein co-chaperone [Providencia]APC09812.1 hypothetical protein RB151_000960 [Providencia rettgeri]AVL73474.1 EscG/YscG/SsaH family type III secretion system needle protein co-chaperone [Providencia rettgeri]EIL1984906.1 EscG/YscG/SsaH family type III secretion system needle protein co-chaperone [Providencia rettgeri]EIU7557800.1 EscG/YscG/SsaH family type III secretion system needle protein co-chaperone [Providencia rett